MLHFGHRSTPLNQIDDLIHPSLFTRLKAKIFHKIEVTRIKRVLLWSFAIFTLLSLLATLSYYFDLYFFATKITTSTPFPVSSATNEELTKLLLGKASEQGVLSTTWLGILGVILFALAALLLELTLVWALLRSWVWRPLSILSKIALSIIAQLLLFVPLILYLFTPDIVIVRLRSLASTEVESYHASLLNPTENSAFVTTPEKVIEKLDSTLSPQLISGDFTQQAVLLRANLNDVESFYRGGVIPTSITQISLSPLPYYSIATDTNKFLLSPDLPVSDLQKILTLFTQKIWQESLPSLSMTQAALAKQSPTISFLESSEYNQIQQTKLDLRKKKLQSYIAELKAAITQNNEYVAESQRALGIIETAKAEYSSRTQALLHNCREIYDESSCVEAEIMVRRNLDEYDQELSITKENLAQAQANIPTLAKYRSIAEQNYANFLKYPIIPEFQVGIFEPPNTISIKYESDTAKGREVVAYYYTLLHELAHYYSDNSNYELPSFLEEGITDYLSQKVGSEFAPNTYSTDGYPEERQIAKLLSDKLGEPKLISLYLDKSPSLWSKEIDSLCGTGCYSKFIKIGQNLTFAPLDDTEYRNSLLGEALSTLSTP